jgi:hypothetical protein
LTTSEVFNENKHLIDDGGLSSCFVCGDDMLPPQPFKTLENCSISDFGHNMLSCDSGHSFCINCWSGSVTVKVRDNSLGCLPCPGFKCGEILDVKWAPILLDSSELVQQFYRNRKLMIIDCCASLKSCPVDGCGLIVYVSALQDDAQHVFKIIPPSAMCGNGHLFCLQCSQPAHSPCTCEQLPVWQQLVQEEIAAAGLENSTEKPGEAAGADLANGMNIFV